VFQHVFVQAGRKQGQAVRDAAYFAQPASLAFGVGCVVQLQGGAAEQRVDALQNAGRHQLHQFALGKQQYQRFCRAEVGNAQTRCTLHPAIAKGFAALVAFNREALRDDVKVALHGAQAHLVAFGFELLLEFAAGGELTTGDVAHDVEHQQGAVEGQVRRRLCRRVCQRLRTTIGGWGVAVHTRVLLCLRVGVVP